MEDYYIEKGIDTANIIAEDTTIESRRLPTKSDTKIGVLGEDDDDDWHAACNVSISDIGWPQYQSYSHASSHSDFAIDYIWAETMLWVDGSYEGSADAGFKNTCTSAAHWQSINSFVQSAETMSGHKFEDDDYVNWYPELTAGPVSP